jgi:hypothetical protein
VHRDRREQNAISFRPGLAPPAPPAPSAGSTRMPRSARSGCGSGVRAPAPALVSAAGVALWQPRCSEWNQQ